MANRRLRLGLAQVSSTVGDLDRNLRRPRAMPDRAQRPPSRCPAGPLSRRRFAKLVLGAAGLGLASACLPPSLPAATPAPTSMPAPAMPPTLAPLPTLRPATSPAVVPPRPTASPAAAAGPGPAPSVVRGGTLVYATVQDPDSLDPANALTTAANPVLRALYDGLVRLGPGLQVQPALASRWTISQDGLLYTFVLRTGLRFHDGTPFDASAALFNLERLTSTGAERGRRRTFPPSLVRAVRAPEPHTLEIQLDRPFAPFLYHLTQAGAAMVSPEAQRRGPGDPGRTLAGTGPFRLAEWLPNNRLIVERFDDGWRGPPRLDRIVFRPVPDPAARVLLLEVGEAHLAADLPAELADRLERDRRFTLGRHPTTLALGIAINTQARALQDRRARQALNYAVDKEAIVRALYRGRATPLGSGVSPSVAGAAKLAPYPFDQARARQLLAEAGGTGIELPLLGPRNRFPRDAELLAEVGRQLAAVGVRTRLELQDWQSYIAALVKPRYESQVRLALQGWSTLTGEAYGALQPLFHSSEHVPGGSNAAFFQSQTFDQALEQAIQAAAEPDQLRLYREAQEIVRDEAPWIFLVSPEAAVVRLASLTGLSLSPLEGALLDEHSGFETGVGG